MFLRETVRESKDYWGERSKNESVVGNQLDFHFIIVSTDHFDDFPNVTSIELFTQE